MPILTSRPASKCSFWTVDRLRLYITKYRQGGVVKSYPGRTVRAAIPLFAWECPLAANPYTRCAAHRSVSWTPNNLLRQRALFFYISYTYADHHRTLQLRP